jgi:hypothetical protein
MKNWIGLIFILMHLCFSGEYLHAQLTNVYGVFPTINPSYRFKDGCVAEGYYFGASPMISPAESREIQVPQWLMLYAEQSLSGSFGKGWSMTGSYVFQKEQLAYKRFVNEHRLYFQIAKLYAWKNKEIKMRLRHDNRFFDDYFKHRIRYQVSYKQIFNDYFYWVTGQEFFFNLSHGNGRVYNENWFNSSLGIRLGKLYFLELGVLNVIWHTDGKNWLNQWYFQPTLLMGLN